MDLASVMISLIVFGLVAIPVTLIIQLEKKRKNKVFLSLTKIAEVNNALITQKELWGKYAIGIDENSKKLIYMNYHPGKEGEYSIDLNKVKYCKIDNVSKTISTGNIRETTTYKLNLLLTYHDPKLPVSAIEFYNADNEGALIADFQQAEKWASVINDAISIK